MAGIPPEHAERLLVTERLRLDALDCPVRYEVWREYASAGPQVRIPLLLERAAAQNKPGAAHIALELGRRLRAARPPRDRRSPSIRATLRRHDGTTVEPAPAGRAERSEAVVSFGEWVLVHTDLFELVVAVLPLTPWSQVVADVRSAPPAALVSLLEPPGPTARPAGASPPPAPDRADADARWGRRSWLARVLARLWGLDPDLDSERQRAAVELAERFGDRSADEAGGADARPEVERWSGAVASANLDRRVTTSVARSSRTIKADAARALFEVDCSRLTWAVVDTGIDARHPAFSLKGPGDRFGTRVTRVLDFTRIDQRTFREVRESPDFLATMDKLASLQLPEAADDPAFTRPPDSHGTHVAGILAGHWEPGTPDKEPVLGICPDLRLWDLRVIGQDKEGVESRVLMALQYVRETNERAGQAFRVCGVNLSLSIPYNPESFCCGWTPVCQEVRRLVRSGVVVVAAAGNTGFDETLRGTASAGRGFATVGITDPGNAEEAITVGATHRFEPHRYGASFFSSKGPTADGRAKPDVLAPGENIFSAIGRDDSGALNGTSQAAPHVSGAAALLLARHPELLGQPERVKQILCSNATDLGRNPYFQGAGLVDVLRALQAV